MYLKVFIISVLVFSNTSIGEISETDPTNSTDFIEDAGIQSNLLKSSIKSDPYGMFREIGMIPDWVARVYNLGIDLASIFTQHPYPIELKKMADKYEYDYIVVGGGGAGSIVAARLSEIPENKVLVLEAGGEESGFSRIGNEHNLYLNSENHHWHYEAEPEKFYARGIKGNRASPSAAKMLGGCSSHNRLLWNRGDPLDYDRWAQLGAKGWAFVDIFPYLIKSEGVVLDEIGSTAFDRGYHGTKGPVRLTGSVNPGLFSRSLIKGAQEVGFPFGDNNGRNFNVFAYSWNNLYNGSRVSMASAYLGPASSRPNLDILINALVYRVNFDENKRAIGVTFEKDGKVQQARARKEVILSAGTYASPQILMLSGVGPKKELQKHKIPVVVDLPGVGQNFQDHPKGNFLFTMENNETQVYIEPESYIKGAKDFKRSRTGVFASLSGRIQGHFRTKYALDSRPDGAVEIYPGLDGTFESNIINGYIQELTDEVNEKYYVPQSYKQGFLIELFCHRTLSRGEIRLKSADPHDSPIFLNRFFQVKRDLEVMVEVCLTALKIVNSRALQEGVAGKPFPNTLPGCEKYPIGTPEFCRCLILTITFSGNHQSGTCKMGSKDDIMAVVDPELRVRGVKGVRVIDASIMPELTSGNTMAPTVMIAERGSDIIKGRILKPSLPPFKREDDVLKYQSYTSMS
ncbi:L-sorbose 1-dehydrogenase-like [Brevipalpus obovatus]|uniref:L-sorbose 1-dehydrogenase-like n=1 Tax=Brevipalpus obovatus TaxID=246614 RepID=UPI003D9DBE36